MLRAKINSNVCDFPYLWFCSFGMSHDFVKYPIELSNATTVHVCDVSAVATLTVEMCVGLSHVIERL